MYNSSKLWLVALQGDTLLGSKFEVFRTLYLQISEHYAQMSEICGFQFWLKMCSHITSAARNLNHLFAKILLSRT